MREFNILRDFNSPTSSNLNLGAKGYSIQIFAQLRELSMCRIKRFETMLTRCLEQIKDDKPIFKSSKQPDHMETLTFNAYLGIKRKVFEMFEMFES